MSKDAIRVEGVVKELLPNTMFRVQLQNGHEILAHAWLAEPQPRGGEVMDARLKARDAGWNSHWYLIHPGQQIQ